MPSSDALIVWSTPYHLKTTEAPSCTVLRSLPSLGTAHASAVVQRLISPLHSVAPGDTISLSILLCPLNYPRQHQLINTATPRTVNARAREDSLFRLFLICTIYSTSSSKYDYIYSNEHVLYTLVTHSYHNTLRHVGSPALYPRTALPLPAILKRRLHTGHFRPGISRSQI